MIQRTIFIKLKDEHVSQRRIMADEITEAWPAPATLSVGIPADDHAAEAWDLMLSLTEPSMEMMKATLESELWTERLWPWLEAQAIVTKGWSFTLI